MSDIPYQKAVGSLLLAAQITRLDIQFAVSLVSRFNNNPGNAHWMAVKRIMRYLKGTIDYKYERDGNSDLIGFCDADWGSDADDRRSTTGYVFTLQGAPVSWLSRKQATIALSTTEAEYMSMSSATQEALLLRELQSELLGLNATTLINCDNKGAVQL